MEVAHELTLLVAFKLIVYTFGALVYLFLMVLILGNRAGLDSRRAAPGAGPLELPGAVLPCVPAYQVVLWCLLHSVNCFPVDGR